MKRKLSFYLFSTLLVLSLTASIIGCTVAEGSESLSSKEKLRLATTTSLYDTGLWDYLEPIFEEKFGAELDILYAGTGIALEYGRRGDVDIITVHSKAQEEQFVAEGYGVKRVPFAYNYFLIVGPGDDPAGIKGLSPEDAFKKLAQGRSWAFVSRGDASGTHAKEKEIWQSAGYDYEGITESGKWYIETGRGMGATLLMSGELKAYTLTDLGSFLSSKGKIELVPIVDRGEILLNVYSAIAVSPERNPKANYEMGKNLIQFLTSPEIQELIGSYGTREYSRQLFTPCAGVEPKS